MLRETREEMAARIRTLETTVSQLRESERRYRGVVESGQDMIVRIDTDFRFTFVNDAACRTWGRCREDLMGTHMFSVVFPDDLPNTLASIKSMIEPPHRTHIIERDLTSQGIRWISWECCGILDEEGRVLEYQGVGRDITDFRHLQQELFHAKDELEQRVVERTAQLERALAERAQIANELVHQMRRFQAIERTIPIGIFESDAAGLISFANTGLGELTGFGSQAMLGHGWRNVLVGTQSETVFMDWHRAVVEQQPFFAEVMIRRADGRDIWVLCQAAPQFGPEGQFQGHVGTLTEITHQKQVQDALRDHQRELRLAKEEAERANLAKSKFLAAASHDLRQPLQAANLFLAVLQNRDSEPERSFILDKLQQSLSALESLLNTLLDVSKLEAGVSQPNPSVFPLGELLIQLASEFAPRAAEVRLRFRVIAPNYFVQSDRTFLERILRNLLSNALTYTRKGGILLGVRKRGSRLRIEVWDTGIGIPEDKLDEIFEDFTQLDNQHRDRDRGLGLGLAIVKRIAKLLDCRITVRSELGRGSMFACEVPVAPSPPPAIERRPLPPEAVGEGAVIAVIDDEASVRDGLALLLSDWGHAPVVGATVEEVLAELRELAQPPEIVIADYQLAGNRTGTEAIEMIRASGGRRVPAIVLTGDTAPEHLTAARSKDYILLHKPIGQEHLRLVLGSLLEGNRADRI